jgi:aminopeptidase N
MYTVTVTAPDDLQLITSGVEIDRTSASDGMTTTTWSAAPSRDVVMLADADMLTAQDETDGTTVTSWYHEGQESAGDAALLWTIQSLDLFNGLLGEYPYTTLQVIPAAMFNAAGVEYPQLFTVSDTYYDREVDLDAHGYFEFTVAHEVVHQWFYGIVGNNQYDAAFIDEGLTNYLSSRVYFTAMYGEEIGEAVFERNIRTPFEYMVEANNDVIVATPTDAFPTDNDYVNAVYIKAPMGFFAIHETLGDDAFFDGLRAYVDAFRFRVATPADLLAAWQAVTDEDIAALWTRWFERREGTLDIRD